MTTTLALRFLTLVLFFFTNDQGISARDLKVELRDEKQVDSKDAPYITQYITTKPNYAASYITTKHTNHLPHHEKPIQPYIDGYNGYKTSAHDSNGLYTDGYNGYKTHSHDSNGPYKAAYGNQESKQPNYIAGYRTRSHDSNKPYTTSYGDHESKQPNYIAGYRTHTHDSNGLYTNGYIGYKTRSHDSNGPYEAAYGNQESKQPNDIAGYKTHSHDSNEPYKTSYGGHDSSEPYITGYITSGGGADAHEANQPYIDGYTSTSRDSKGSTSNNLEDSKSPSSRDSKEPISPNIDRIEAFKTGFFTLDDLYVGNVMTLQFPIQQVSPFLSRKEADSIPLSMSQLSSVLQLFSIPEDSPEAKSIRRTLEQCEDEPITGETKTCAKSLESMLEFVDKVIGLDTKRNILTTSYPSPSAVPLQKYTILEVSHDVNAPKWVACHPLPYPYAIHYCHFIATGTKVFKVSLVGENNGDKMEALGICHLDTSDWSPDHIIFKQLGIKAGKDQPVCHFFPARHLLWVPQSSKANM